MSEDAYALGFRDAACAAKTFEIGTPLLMRAIMAHPSWSVAGAYKDGQLELGVLRDEGSGARVVELFSDDQAVDAFEDALGGERAYGSEGDPRRVTMSGFALIEALAGVASDKIAFDPLNPHTFSYGQHQYELLSVWANIVKTELAILAPDRLENAIAHLTHDSTFHVVLQGVERDLVLAPDANGRALAALFSAPDALGAFMDALDEADGPFDSEPHRGEALFSRLIGMPLDGFVLNPLGPTVPRAVSNRIFPRLVRHHH